MIYDWHLLFIYDISGKLFRKTTDSNNCDITQPAGKLHKATGYKRVSIGNAKVREHRIVWEMFNGPIPEGYEIDHINHIRSDNRLENLRLVTRKVNMRNTSKRSDNTSGCVGVGWDNCTGKWKAQIQVDGKNINLGRYTEMFDAICARKSAEYRFGFHANHGIGDII